MSLDEPSAPSRVRLVRPQLYRSEATGTLAPDVRDLLVGLTTLSDDEGWLLWRRVEVAAALYPYAPSSARLRDLERRAARLIEAELLVVHDCGCAFLPSLKRDHAVKGGRQTSAVWSWHSSHPPSGPVRASPSEAVPSSVSPSSLGSSSSLGSASASVSSSSSFSNTDSSSLPARDMNGDARYSDGQTALPASLRAVLSSLANPDDLNGRDLLTVATFIEERGTESVPYLEAISFRPGTTAQSALAYWAKCVETGIPLEAMA